MSVNAFRIRVRSVSRWRAIVSTSPTSSARSVSRRFTSSAQIPLGVLCKDPRMLFCVCDDAPRPGLGLRHESIGFLLRLLAGLVDELLS